MWLTIDDKGYYFAATQETDQLSIATAFGQVPAKRGLLLPRAAVPKQLDAAEIDDMAEVEGWSAPIGRYLFVSNARTVPDRARKCFGYEVKQLDVYESMDADVLAIVGLG